jgi:predicted membrane-bound spermidine synthase
MRLAAYAVFLASGFSALIYQIVWQRLLGVFAGSDVHSATIIVAAFMVGLGCGSFAGACLSDRLSRSANLACFALAELAIGVFGFASTSLFYDGLYQRLGHLPLSIEARAAVLFLALLWPTFFMGLSLPLLARALTRGLPQAARVTGALYAANTIGAAAGALVATWGLLRLQGFAGSVKAAAAINVLAAVATLALVRPRRDPHETQAAPEDSGFLPQPAPDDIRLPFAVWALIYFVAGMIALSLEIVWFRLAGVMLKSTAFTFGTVLSIYLAGIGGGAALGSMLVARARRPGRAFLLLQAAIGLYAGASVALLLAQISRARLLRPLADYLAGYEPFDVRRAAELPMEFALLYVLVPLLLVGPPTWLMGASLPLLQRTVQTDVRHLGRRIGTLMTANIAGSALGAILTGWVWLTWLGTHGTLKLLVAASATFPLCGLVWSFRASGQAATRVAHASAIGGAVVIVAMIPGEGAFWARLHGGTPSFVVAGEDGSGTSLLRKMPADPRVVLFVNGIGQSWIPYGGIHTVLGALPAFIHPRPRTAIVIGLGSGDTVFAVAGRPGLEQVTCVEIIRPQIDTLARLDAVWRYPGLRSVLTHPRIAHRDGDGRTYLMRSRERYDLIEADALRPTSAYAGNLYSEQYFELMRGRLNRGGLAVSWAPTPRVHDTFVKVFPHALAFGDIVVGSNDPIAFDRETLRARLADPAVRDYFGAASVDIATLMDTYIERTPRAFAPDHDRTRLVDTNTDLFPKDEFSVE